MNITGTPGRNHSAPDLGKIGRVGLTRAIEYWTHSWMLLGKHTLLKSVLQLCTSVQSEEDSEVCQTRGSFRFVGMRGNLEIT